MKLITLISIAVLVATAIFGQTMSQQDGNNTVNAGRSSMSVAAPLPPKAPVLNTAKFWRLAFESQSAHDAVNQTPQGKAAQAADKSVQEEQAILAAACGKTFQLQIDQNPDSPTFKDLICGPKTTDKPKDK